MQSAGLTFIMSQSQCAICPGLSLTQTRTREVVLDLFGPGTWRVPFMMAAGRFLGEDGSGKRCCRERGNGKKRFHVEFLD